MLLNQEIIDFCGNGVIKSFTIYSLIFLIILILVLFVFVTKDKLLTTGFKENSLLLKSLGTSFIFVFICSGFLAFESSSQETLYPKTVWQATVYNYYNNCDKKNQDLLSPFVGYFYNYKQYCGIVKKQLIGNFDHSHDKELFSEIDQIYNQNGTCSYDSSKNSLLCQNLVYNLSHNFPAQQISLEDIFARYDTIKNIPLSKSHYQYY